MDNREYTLLNEQDTTFSFILQTDWGKLETICKYILQVVTVSTFNL
jgi:hypothetical protein